MGVNGLWSLLLPIGHRISVETLSNKTLAIDASIWITQFVKAIREDSDSTNNYQMKHAAHLIGFLRRLCKLLYHGIKPVVVFDGETPEIKKRETRERSLKRKRLLDGSEGSEMKRMAKRILLQELKKMKVSHIKDSKTGNDDSDIMNKNETIEIHNDEKNDKIENETNDTNEKNTNSGEAQDVKNNYEEIVIEDDANELVANEYDVNQLSLNEDEMLEQQQLYEIAKENGKKTCDDYDCKNENKDVINNADEDAIGNDDEEEQSIASNTNENSISNKEEEWNMQSLLSLPSTSRKEYVDDMKRQQRLNTRKEYMPVAGNPEAYSQVQLKNFLKVSRLNKSILKASKVVKQEEIECNDNKDQIIYYDDNDDAVDDDDDDNVLIENNCVELLKKKDNNFKRLKKAKSANNNYDDDDDKEEETFEIKPSDCKMNENNNNATKAIRNAYCIDSDTEDDKYDVSSDEGGGFIVEEDEGNKVEEKGKKEEYDNSSDESGGFIVEEKEEFGGGGFMIEDEGGGFIVDGEGNNDKSLGDEIEEVGGFIIEEKEEIHENDDNLDKIKQHDHLKRDSYVTKTREIISIDNDQCGADVNDIKENMKRRDCNTTSDEMLAYILQQQEQEQYNDNSNATFAFTYATNLKEEDNDVIIIDDNVRKKNDNDIATDSIVKKNIDDNDDSKNEEQEQKNSNESEDDDDVDWEEGDDTFLHDNTDQQQQDGDDDEGVDWEDGDDTYLQNNGNQQQLDEQPREDGDNNDKNIDWEDGCSEDVIVVSSCKQHQRLQNNGAELHLSSHQEKGDEDNDWNSNINSVMQSKSFDNDGATDDNNDFIKVTRTTDALKHAQETASHLTNWAGRAVRKAIAEFETANPQLSQQKESAVNTAQSLLQQSVMNEVDVRDSKDDDDDDNNDDKCPLLVTHSANEENNNNDNITSVEIENDVSKLSNDSNHEYSYIEQQNLLNPVQQQQETSINDITQESNNLSSNATTAETTTAPWSYLGQSNDHNNMQQVQGLMQSQLKREQRDLDFMTSEMKDEVIQLLHLLGIPYVLSPAEAEAQCATLETLGLVDGIVTEDSDAFVFGAKTVYRNIFDQKKYVEVYCSKDAEQDIDLNRNCIIALAMLLGGDYTEGVKGVGIVNGMEILRAFSMKNEVKDGLESFRCWLEDDALFETNENNNNSNTDTTKSSKKKNNKADSIHKREYMLNGKKMNEQQAFFHSKHKSARLRWKLPSKDFPAPNVLNAYLYPVVDKSTTKFTWGQPDFENLYNFSYAKIGWTNEQTNAVLGPLIQKLSRDRTSGRQTRIDSFFMKYEDNYKFANVQSKRLQDVLRSIKNDEKKKKDKESGNKEVDDVKINERNGK